MDSKEESSDSERKNNSLFNVVAKRMNYYSGYLLDWTRVGELLREGNHKYSFVEIVPRLFIGTCTILPFILQRKVSMKSSFQALIMFALSHAVVLNPLITKRKSRQAECASLATAIKGKFCKCTDNTCNICNQIQTIMTETTISEKSSEVWGMRLRKMKQLSFSLDSK